MTSRKWPLVTLASVLSARRRVCRRRTEDEKGQRELGIQGGRESWRWKGGFLEDEETRRERCLGSWIGAEGLRALAGASRSKGKEKSWGV